MDRKFPQGLTKLSELSGITPEVFWGGTTRLPGLKGCLTSPDKIELFDRVVESAINRFKGKMSDFEVAMQAMNLAGEALLDERPVAPDSIDAFLDRAASAGILRQVPRPERT